MKKLRVLFLTRKWPPAIGGMEVYSMELSEELSHRVDLTVRSLSGKKDGSPPGIARLVYFLFSNLVYLWRTRRDFDVVHFGDFVLFSLAWWHARWAPSTTRIVSVFGLDLLFGNRSGWESVLYSRFVSWAIRRQALVDCFLAISRYTSIICSKLNLEKVVVIPLGVRLKKNLPIFSPKRSGRERYILFIGRLVRRKGASWFARNVLPALPDDVKFYVAGKSWDCTEVEMLKNNPRVHLMGHVSDDKLPSLIGQSEMIVMPNVVSPDMTDAEGFGLVALEGPAHGVPCVASNIEGLQDAVRPSETGFLVPAEDPDAWVTQVKQILEWGEAERESFGRRAKEYLDTHFSWSRVANDTLLLLFILAQFFVYAYSGLKWPTLSHYVENTFLHPGNSINLTDTRGMIAIYPTFVFYIFCFHTIKDRIGYGRVRQFLFIIILVNLVVITAMFSGPRIKFIANNLGSSYQERAENSGPPDMPNQFKVTYQVAHKLKEQVKKGQVIFLPPGDSEGSFRSVMTQVLFSQRLNFADDLKFGESLEERKSGIYVTQKSNKGAKFCGDLESVALGETGFILCQFDKL